MIIWIDASVDVVMRKKTTQLPRGRRWRVSKGIETVKEEEDKWWIWG
jgi:hypothetical protein